MPRQRSAKAAKKREEKKFHFFRNLFEQFLLEFRRQSPKMLSALAKTKGPAALGLTSRRVG
jgi:hypothetical protein